VETGFKFYEYLSNDPSQHKAVSVISLVISLLEKKISFFLCRFSFSTLILLVGSFDL